jgi:hypothetical protein
MVNGTEHVASSGLDWQAFSARYFPGRPRHDLEALTAYGAYRRLRVVAPASEGTSPALEAWEDDGGPAL